MASMASQLSVAVGRVVRVGRPLLQLVPRSSNSTRQQHGLTLHPQLLSGLNCQIQLELQASYTYLAMATFFNQQNMNLPGCHQLFMRQVKEEQEHAQKFIDFVLLRGGKVGWGDLAGGRGDWNGVLEVFVEALALEELVTERLVQLYTTSESLHDAVTSDLVQSTFLPHQAESLDEFQRHITRLKRMGDMGLGLELFDRDMRKT